MRNLLIFLAFIAVVVAYQAKYDRCKVFRIYPWSKQQFEVLRYLEESDEAYSFWNRLSHFRPADLMVAPHKLNEFSKLMSKEGIQYNTYVDDVQKIIDNQKFTSSRDSSFDWTSYHTLEEIYNWLEGLQKNYPNVVKVIVGGRTYEGREIKGVKISFAEENPGVFIESGIHAREWIGPATATYLINEFLTSKDPAVRKLAESHDWYIFPSFNPDGYVYTHTTDRLWRKTRSKSNNTCYGADANRNWDSMWMKVGASNNTCSNLYAGSAAFSEIETKTLSEYIKSIGDKLFAYISFHSYSHLLLFPYGFTKEHLGNYNQTYSIGLETVNALSKRYGTKYKLGTFYDALYPGSGISIDWVKATLNLPVVFLFELRDNGTYGFLLPPDQIIPNGQEILSSFLALFSEASKQGYP